MRVSIDMRVLELLTARFVHELVSPIGAVNNGVELLGEEDPDFVRDAVELIGQSGRRAGKRLQFYRFAYGTAPTANVGGPEPGELVAGLLDGSKVGCEWTAEAKVLPPEWQKLACNMVVLGEGALPRGGRLTVRPLKEGASGIEVAADGDQVNVSPELRAAIGPNAVVDDLTSRTVHAYFTARLAERMGASLAIAAPVAGQVVFTAVAGKRS